MPYIVKLPSALPISTFFQPIKSLTFILLLHPPFPPCPQVSTPWGTWFTVCQEAATTTIAAVVEEAQTAAVWWGRPCRTTPSPLSAAHCMRSSPRIWRTPRPWGTPVASRSSSALHAAKETSKRSGKVLLVWNKHLLFCYKEQWGFTLSACLSSVLNSQAQPQSGESSIAGPEQHVAVQRSAQPLQKGTIMAMTMLRTWRITNDVTVLSFYFILFVFFTFFFPFLYLLPSHLLFTFYPWFSFPLSCPFLSFGLLVFLLFLSHPFLYSFPVLFPLTYPFHSSPLFTFSYFVFFLFLFFSLHYCSLFPFLSFPFSPCPIPTTFLFLLIYHFPPSPPLLSFPFLPNYPFLSSPYCPFLSGWLFPVSFCRLLLYDRARQTASLLFISYSFYLSCADFA